MTYRAVAILVTLCSVAAGGLVFADDPGLLWTVVGKLGEGGMWTALAAFVVIAAGLGYRRRDASGGSRPSAARRH